MEHTEYPEMAVKGIVIKFKVIIIVNKSEGNVNSIDWNNITVIYLNEKHQGNSKRNLAGLLSVEMKEKGDTLHT